MGKPKIYMSGPCTLAKSQGYPEKSHEPQIRLIKAGLSPLNPMLTLYVAGHEGISHEDWIEVDKEWIRASNGLLRLEGKSPGADEEVEFAGALGIPVFYDVETLLDYYKGRKT